MLEVKDATIAIGKKVLAANISFIARDGKLTCVTGPEGSGKSVMIRTLMGFLPVKEGFVSVDGELLTTLSAAAFRKWMVYLPQDIQTLAHQLEEPEAPKSDDDDYTVWGQMLPKVSPETAPEPLADEAICRLIEKTLEEAGDKQIVIADDPTAQLSPLQVMHVYKLLRQQADAGKTVLLATRTPMLLDYADEVIRLGMEDQN